ncbi:endonuclease [Fulvivirga ligni]|uniref:endonuclease n=1 Tax=Fulvivirga ligni TaxID=2904246 RepID=UPI001F1BFBC6|nr:endonuclease [Fulvivirga ligni]UII22774.1 endonuclease [Fulvivirga ligni]
MVKFIFSLENKPIWRRFSALILFLVVIIGSAYSQIPDNYYIGAEGESGEELKLILHNIIRNHKRFSYSQVKDFISEADADPQIQGNILLFYSGRSMDFADIGIGGNDWNREHIWAKSHGFPEESDTAYTDFHHLRPSDASVNTNRSNKDFNNVPHTEANEEGEAPDTYTNDNFWEPKDEVKGDVARMLFYMDVRYESSVLDLELVDRISHSGDPELGVLHTLLEWHNLDPVDQSEIDRNNAVFEWQENRNPFVDHPEWVAAVYGAADEPLLLLNTDSFNADFGLVEAGSSKTQVYAVNSYDLEGDVTVTVEAPFSLSLDNESWTNSLTINNEVGEEQINEIYLRFSPTEEGAFSSTVSHSTTGAVTRSFEVQGEEGTIEVMTIAEARSMPLDAVVYVSGVVIDAGNNSANNRVIYDGTAGIMVRSFDAGNESANLSLGDSILVSGILDSYNELLQISKSPITIEVLKQGVELPEPQEVTIANIDEDYESELVLIKNVRFEDSGNFAGGGSSGNFTITDGVNDFTFRIGDSNHPLVGQPIPSGTFDLIGIIGQFQSDYQISPRTSDDLIFNTSEEPLLSLNLDSFDTDFGVVEAGSSKTQVYALFGYDLDDDVTVTVEAPFSLSLDNENWTNSLNITNEEGDQQTNQIYLRFSPLQEGSFTSMVSHSSTGAESKSFEVVGEEGIIEVMTIAEARTQSLDAVVMVSGVVIDAGNNNANNRVIYDGTAGIMVRSFDAGNESANLAQGDSILVSGILDSYNNLLQISKSPITIEILKHNVALPEPQEVTIAEVNEDYESELVLIKNVSFKETGVFAGGGSDGNFTITDGSNDITFRIGDSNHPLVGESIPTDNFDLIGIVGQFQNDYQVSPRTQEDLIFNAGPDPGDVTGFDELIEAGISAYPNPISDVLYIESTGGASFEYKIMTVNGNILVNKKGADVVAENISGFASGLYLLTITSESKTYTIKVIKE